MPSLPGLYECARNLICVGYSRRGFMSANVIENSFSVSAAKDSGKPLRKGSLWPAAVLASFGASIVFFGAGILLSAATTLGFVAASRFIAYLDVAFLFTAFLLAFVGAHALDRSDEIRRKSKQTSPYYRNNAVIDLEAAKSKFSRRK